MYDRLKKLETEGSAIRVGATCFGWMGGGFVAAMRHVPGMEVSVVAADDPAEGVELLTRYGGRGSEDIVVDPTNAAAAEDAVRAGKTVVTADTELMAQVESLDLITDVTPFPESGARTAWHATENGKDVVLISIETDVTVGRELTQRAREAGTLYSVSSGDEPGCLMELWDFVRTLGYEPIVIGKGKNNPLNPDATPETVRESAARAGKDAYQVAS